MTERESQYQSQVISGLAGLAGSIVPLKNRPGGVDIGTATVLEDGSLWLELSAEAGNDLRARLEHNQFGTISIGATP